MTLPTLTFGVVPFKQDNGARLLLNDFCARLGDAIGHVVHPHRAPSPEALAAAVSAGRVHVAWLSPTLLATSKLADLVVPLASSIREGSAQYHAALFARDDSPIKAAEDLARKRVAWVAPSSASGYIYPRLALARRGLDPRTLFASEGFHQSHGAVAAAVSEGRADVGATFVSFENGDPSRPVARAGFRELEGASPARIVLMAGPIPADVIVALRSFNPQFRANLLRALKVLAAGEATSASVQSIFGVRTFAAHSENALATLHQMIKSARDMGLL
ncbi:phosphate/phosphite/phosphonate ABC transporter substrate-binding protein [Polyangium aurulentum]|uniref:phosphate/phosphite/phosphonate ABC transporter substrate-binding protein n=1 Tax=Polyangium aurulentum TaxID=2567896 RepID=UPI0010AE0D95|nr:PhnD/SsuA/transferrin family substrate-binding protein [Polyangium aurulentum]UQA54623.1 PhnD/SsuA/transferrin family substrate-binding protein [Polyangium aurulentum]